VSDPPAGTERILHPPIKAVTFDFWGTLYENGTDRTSRYLQVLAAALPGFADDELSAAFHSAEQMASDVGRLGFRLCVPGRVAVMLDNLGTSLPPEPRRRLVLALENVVLEMPPPLVEGVSGVLATLRDRGYALGLISDTGMAPGRVMRELMQRDGVAHFFQHLTFSDELGVTKRWPQAFRSTCMALGVAPEETLHVGDLPETDIRTGKVAGLHTALATYVSHRYDGAKDADLVLSRLTELPDMLARL